VSDDQLVQRITEQSAFRNSQGEFVRARFETALQRAGLTEQDYTELLRTDVHRRQLLTAATSGIAAPDYLAETLYKYRNERRVAKYAVIEDSDFNAGDPAQSDLRRYYENHDEPFMAPPYREVTLIHLTSDQLRAEVKVSEDELREAYEARRDEFDTPQRRRLRQIVFDSRDGAETAMTRLRQGAAIDAVAEDMQGGSVVDLGTTTRDGLLPALTEPAFEAAEGEVVGPIETSLGFHVVEVAEVLPGETRSFEDVRDQLREDLAQDRAVDALVSLANNLDDELATGASLEEAARALGLDTRKIPAVDRQGRNRDGEPIEGLPERSTFTEAVFNTDPGEQSLLRETGDGEYFVVRVDSVIEPQKRPFADVREQVAERWRADQLRSAAREAAKSLRSSLDAGDAFEQAAKLLGVEVQTTQPLARSGNSNAAPAAQALAGSLFDTEAGNTVTAEIDRGVVVAKLTEVQVPDPDESQQQLTQLRGSVAQALERDVFQQFVNALRERYTVRINQSQLDTILNRMN
jgi:peptidyl-prolyl cis-trans isomerase D